MGILLDWACLSNPKQIKCLNWVLRCVMWWGRMPPLLREISDPSERRSFSSPLMIGKGRKTGLCPSGQSIPQSAASSNTLSSDHPRQNWGRRVRSGNMLAPVPPPRQQDTDRLEPKAVLPMAAIQHGMIRRELCGDTRLPTVQTLCVAME